MKRIIISTVVIICMTFSLILLLNVDSNGTFETVSKNEVKQFERELEDSLMIELGKRLYNEDYSFGLEWEALSKEEVKITIKFPIEKVSSELEDGVKKTIDKVVKESDLNPAIFTIEITNYEV